MEGLVRSELTPDTDNQMGDFAMTKKAGTTMWPLGGRLAAYGMMLGLFAMTAWAAQEKDAKGNSAQDDKAATGAVQTDPHAGHDHGPVTPPAADGAKDGAKKDKKKKKDKTGEETTAVDDKGPKPIIGADNETFDFGTIWTGPDLKHTFVITNTGDKELLIKDVRPSCGCTTVGEHADTVKPGEKTELTFSLKSANLSGPFTKTVTIASNDPKNANFKLTMRGEAKNRIEISPMSLAFGSVKSYEEIEKVVTLTNNTDKPLELKLKSDKDPESGFKFVLEEKEKGKVYELKATTTPPLKEGTRNTEVVLTTNIEEQQEITVRIGASVPPRIAVRPTQITYNPKLRSVPIRLLNNGLTEIKVLSASSSDPKVETGIVETLAGQNYTVNLTFPENYEIATNDKIIITIKTDDKEHPEFQVPVISRAMPPKPAMELVGKPAPEFKLVSAAGKEVSNAWAAKEGPIVVNFIAGDCGYCKKQMPRLELIRKDYESKGVKFMGIVEKMRADFTADQIKGVLKELEVNFDFAMDPENTVGGLFRANSYPTLFVIGKDGKVELAEVGNVDELEANLSKKLDQLLGITKTESGASTTVAETGETTKSGGAADAAHASAEKPKADQPKAPAPKAPKAPEAASTERN